MRWRAFVLIVLTIGVPTSCSGDDDEASSPSSASDGPYVDAEEMGIVYENGLGCFGGEFPGIDGANIFVSPEGDDANPGNTQDAPLRTLAFSLCSVRPGQSVHLAPGTYRESVVLGTFGEPGSAQIIIRGDPENRPVLDGESTRTMGIGIVESYNVVIEGIEFRNYTDEGLSVLLGADIVIRDNVFADNGRESIDPDSEGEGFGVLVQATERALIENNEAYGNGPSDERMAQAMLGTGIDTFEIVDSTIRNNLSHDNRGGGMLVEDGTNVLVEGNHLYSNTLDAAGDWWDGAVWVDGGSGVTLRGNLIENNPGPGIQLSDEDSRYPDLSLGYVLEDNTVQNNRYGLYMWGWGSCPPPEDAVTITAGNQITGNEQRDVWCVDDIEWSDD